MKTLFLSVLLGSVVSLQLYSQEDFQAPRLTKQPIGTSGCYAYLPPNSTQFDVEYSPDSSVIYTGDFEFGAFHYGVITVKLKDLQLTDSLDKENMLVGYLDYLQTSFNITESVGYGKGHTLESNSEALGILDYWVDADGDQWVIKGWVNSNAIGIMMIYGSEEYPNFNVQSMYLNSFRFD